MMKKKYSPSAVLHGFVDNQNKIDSSNDLFHLLIKGIDSDQPISKNEGYKAADYAVCKEIQIESEKTFFKDYLTIKDAIAAVCSENYSQAVELLRPLSFDSHFSQWKLLLRGMIAFYTGDDKKAEMIFVKIEPFTVPSKIAGSFLILLDKNKYLKKEMEISENVLVDTCVVAGFADYKTVLPRAECLWMRKRYGESFIYVSKNLSKFPTFEIGIRGDLTNFYYNMPHHIEEEELDRYISAFNKVIGLFKGKFTIEILLIQKTISILNISLDDKPDNEMLKMWEIFIRAYRELFGEDKVLEAEIYLYIGLFLCGVNPGNQLQNAFAKNSPKPFGLAEKCLLKSIELYKSKDAYLALLEYYKINGKKKEFGSLIDSVIEVFPDDKDLLCEAGNFAAGRNAYNKCIEYYERALSLDPIDSNLRDVLISCYIRAAQSVISNKNGLSKTRKFMDRAESLCPSDPKKIDSELRFVVARRAEYEFFKGNYQKANQELEKAFAMPGKREQFLYFSYLFFRDYELSCNLYKSIVKEVNSMFSSPARLGSAIDLFEVLEYTNKFRSVGWDARRCFNYFLNAIEKELPGQNDFKRVFLLADEFGYNKEACTIVKKALRTDPGNPLYSFYDYYFNKKKKTGYNSSQDVLRNFDKLERINEAARKRNDTETISLVSNEFIELAAFRNFF